MDSTANRDLWPDSSAPPAPQGSPAPPPPVKPTTPPAAKPVTKAPGAVVESTPDPPVNKMRRRIVWASVAGFLTTCFLMFVRFFLPRAILSLRARSALVLLEITHWESIRSGNNNTVSG
ncbi:MAG TPA: hypothetical protein VJM12_12200 [Pyrinomonadaceae bacterium]|nr:hypothetical protein [Pyrinomonadaceae bacterium]